MSLLLTSTRTFLTCVLATLSGLTAQSWIPNAYGTGANGQVNMIAGINTGNMVAAGVFTSISGVAATNIAQWNGASWVPMGAGLAGGINQVIALANGNYLAVVGTNVFLWNGAAWVANGTLPSGPQALIELPGGALVAGGIFSFPTTPSAVMTWNGTAWVPLGAPVSGTVLDFAILPNGNLLASGLFVVGGAQVRLATFTPATGVWAPFAQAGNPGGFVEAIQALPNGDVVTSHRLTSPQRWEIHQTNGTTWTRLAGGINGQVSDMALLPNGAVVVSGAFTRIATLTNTSVARLNGTTWTSLANMNAEVRTLAYLPGGQLAAGGLFTTVNGTSQLRIGAFGPSIPGAATIYGFGCSTATGTSTRLAPTSNPLIGDTYTALATGMSAGFAIQIRGLTQIPAGIPLASVIAGGLPGCNLYASTDLLDAIAPVAAGSLVVGFAVPNDPLLIGATLFHQVASFDAFGNVSSSNGISVTFGNF
ncbi:MAG: hypothetical protein IPK26_00175 [Planctomycetes bacterium]|nr:hypothetical protein [Planctomycetota bacterium]